MTDGIMSMFDSDADITLSHDVRLLYSGRREQYELGLYREVYRKQLHNIIFDLKSNMNFYQFSEYISSFF